MKIEKEIKQYYQSYNEERRLVKDPYHLIEFLITMQFLKKHLPKKGTILDAGGGTGRYAIKLAQMGYKVVLLDFVPKHIEIANDLIKAKGLNQKIQTKIGTIVDLGEYKNQQFDAVLCLGGSLSHLTQPKKIEAAMKELARVAKKNSKIFISVIGRLGVAQYKVRYEQQKIIKYNQTLITGQNIPGMGFTHAHFFLGKELEQLFMNNNLEIVERIGLEGLSSSLEEETSKLYKNKKLWKAWLKILKQTANDPTAYGSSVHFMIIGRKK